MPSPAEYYILVCVLAVVFASLPLAMLVRALVPRPAHKVEAEDTDPRQGAGEVPYGIPLRPPLPPPWADSAGGGMPESPWQPPQAELLPPVPPALPLHHAWTTKDAWFALALALIVAVLMGPVASGAGGTPEKIEFSPALFTVQIIFQAGMIVLVLGYLCLHRRFNPVSLFGLRRMSVQKAAGTALLWLVPAYFIIIMVAYATLPVLQDVTGIELKKQMLVESAPTITDPASQVLMIVTLCIGAPLMEELIFRGVLFSVAARFIHPVYASVATSLFFGAVHANLFSLIPLVLLGMLLAHVYQRTGSLVVPVLMHAFFNCSQVLLLLYGPQEIQ